MNTKKPDSLASLLVLTLALSLQLTSMTSPAAHASELVILYSNDIRGETEPCG
ncbi:MAG: hypothetical protein M8357_10350 [Desulfobulbaceae bacterium]|nr:hypothetical protein [Desulfobulbaceae bacterium]